MTLATFIKKRQHLVWDTHNYNKLSHDAIVQHVLEYGTFDDCKHLFAIMGIGEAAKIFRKQTARLRSNYDPRVVRFFKLYFDRHAPHAPRTRVQR